MIGIQTRHYQSGTVFSSQESETVATILDLCQARCEYKPSPACEHAVPGSRTELLIGTIADTNMALWALGRPGLLYDKSHWLI